MIAPAKINLFLHITGRRSDGLHTIQSLMVFVDVGDHLEFSTYDGFFLDAEGDFSTALGHLGDNLIYKAAVALADNYKTPLRGKIVITKNLPVAAGIGGGSSDAAATLLGLSKLWGLPEDQSRLAKIAEKIGADVPACLYRKPVWAENIGEKMTRLNDMPDIHFVLVNPLVPVSTPQVFDNLEPRYSKPLMFSGRRKSSSEWIADLKVYRNDLTDSALQIAPVIKDVLFALEKTAGCLLHRVSGSGATCFGIYNSAEAAHLACLMLKTRYPLWWITTANMLR
jgi:4-diphosphocytidyl-2-C-methyl-D-erythritol kinase